jgi:hypothetical protein
MEEATGAPSSFTVYHPKRLRASGRDEGGVMNRPPSSLTMPLSRHTSAPGQSWCDPAGASPAQVRSSVRLVASVAWSPATVAAKRTQRLHGVWDRATKGQTLQGPRVFIRSKATCAAPLMRGAVALPGSKATSRAKGSYRNLGGLVSGRRGGVACASTAVRIGKARSRSR